MSYNSISTNSSSDNNETLRLSMNSSPEMNQTSSGYMTRSKKAVSYIF